MAKGQKLNLSDEQIKDILKLHNNGLKDQEIADIYQIGRTTVGKILNNLGISRRPPLEKRVADVLRLYNEGKNQTEIYQELHMDQKNVRKILKDNNVDVTKNSWKHTYKVDEHYFDKIDNPDKAYIIGMLYSDGNLSKNNYDVKLFLQDRDKKILEDILHKLNSDYPLHFYDYSNKPNHKNQYGFIISNRFFYKSLLQYGLFPNKSLTLKYPTNIPNKYQRDFIRGYFDGDGSLHCSKNGKTASFVSTYDFCMTAKKVIEKELNIHCSVYQYYDNGITSTLQISGGKQVPQFLSWIYDNCDLKLERKYLKYLEYYVA